MRSRAITRAKVVSAAGGALGVLVSTEAMENELWAVDLDIIRALICALRRLRAQIARGRARPRLHNSGFRREETS